MRILIVEDEDAAARRIVALLNEIEPSAEICSITDSIKSTLKWLQHNNHPDLALFDIHLADGSSFRIFEEGNISFPVIFTTAYDKYALDAFKVNSIDYLLKPIKKRELAFSINKFNETKSHDVYSKAFIQSILEKISKQEPQYKERFVVNYADKIRIINCSEIAGFYTLQKSVFLLSFENKSFAVDYTLEQLEKELNPREFFRVNRRYILNIKSIKDMYRWSKSRIKIKTEPEVNEEIVVSSERASAFKAWLNQ